MFMLIKRRARKALAMTRDPSITFYPAGVGGFPKNEACVCFEIGDYHVFVQNSAWTKLVADIADARESAR